MSDDNRQEHGARQAARKKRQAVLDVKRALFADGQLGWPIADPQNTERIDRGVGALLEGKVNARTILFRDFKRLRSHVGSWSEILQTIAAEVEVKPEDIRVGWVRQPSQGMRLEIAASAYAEHVAPKLGASGPGALGGLQIAGA